MAADIDERDREILRILQEDANRSYREIGRELGCPVTTVYSRVKKLEETGVIKAYKTVLDASRVGLPTTAFILVRVKFREPGAREPYDFHRIASEISRLHGVQELHMMAGEWDFLVKIRARDSGEVGGFVMDRLRLVEGVDRCLTCMVFETVKESADIPI